MSFSIAHLSDAHLGPLTFPPPREIRLKRVMGYLNWKRGREDVSDMPLLARLVADMKAQRPDHIAMTGDVVNLALASEFARAAAWLASLGDPADVSFAPGNHDAYVRAATPGLMSAFSPWTRSDGALTPSFPYSRVRGEVAIIGLKSGVPTGPLMATGRLGARQIVEFEGLAADAGRRGLARIVLIHHPPLPAGRMSLRALTDADAFRAALTRAGAELVLHGHDHVQMTHFLESPASRTVDGRIPIVGTPSPSTNVRDPGRRAAYHLFRLTREGDAWRIESRARGDDAGAAVNLDSPF